MLLVHLLSLVIYMYTCMQILKINNASSLNFLYQRWSGIIIICISWIQLMLKIYDIMVDAPTFFLKKCNVLLQSDHVYNSAINLR